MILLVALRWALCWDFSINRNLFCIWIFFEGFEFLRRMIYLGFFIVECRVFWRWDTLITDFNIERYPRESVLTSLPWFY